jgi:uncharacterized protein YqeY
MNIQERIQKEMVVAMKAKEEARLSVIRMMKAAFLKYKADQMKEADDAAGMQLLSTLIKQRQDSAQQFRDAGRVEMADKEEAEIRIIEEFLPPLATAEELNAAIDAAIAETAATSAKQMGLVMKAAQTALAGKRVDGKALSELVKARLS